ncbi:MAG: L-aspartate oxidase [Lactobacillaceae bacterium]|jgi:L-aspartate oxidase|nr:L-aspartate oxidase [Lactobacillaceae bacterium]
MKKVIIIGAGLAGCYLASQLPSTYEIHIFTKGSLKNSDSMLAQGGIACALAPTDSWQAHFADTLQAGGQVNHADNVAQLVQQGPQLVTELITAGMAFDCDSTGAFSYGLEGAHQQPRVLHIQGDQTGKYMTQFVQQQLANVTLHEYCMATELIKNHQQVIGIEFLDADAKLNTMLADVVVLATGGLGGLYPLTSNDVTITGDGQAMALRAGVKLADMEFVQFHPTLLSVDGHCHGLISEAIRGAGAHLVDETGQLIMQAHDPRGDLAPRDVVARVITQTYAAGHNVFLNIQSVVDFERHFPQITANLDAQAIPFRQTNLIPVQPGAHFMMGGIAVNAHGQTNLAGLYAVGEVANTGVHGANRLASNSLLECLVFSRAAAKAITTTDLAARPAYQPNARHNRLVLPARTTLQQRAWQAIGIERDPDQIHEFMHWLAQFQYQQLPQQMTQAEFETANMCLIAESIAKAALARPTSLGAHYWKVQKNESIIS